MARTRPDRGSPSPVADALDLRELAVFVEEGPGFHLGLATYDVPATRDATLGRLAALVVDRPVHLSRLDLTLSSQEEPLLRRLHEHIQSHPASDGRRLAIMVVGLEAVIDFHRTPDGVFRGGSLLHTANLQRDSFPHLCPVPLVLWLSPYATTAFAQAAPDLWHWRSASFTFTGTPEARVQIERELVGTPIVESSNLAASRKRERIGMLRDLLAELELAEDRETPGHKARRAAILSEIGVNYLHQSASKSAIEYFQEAMLIYREIGERRAEGAVFGNLGNAYAALGQAEKAIGFYEQQLDIAREIGDRRGECTSLSNLADAYAILGQIDRAIGIMNQAAEVAESIQAPRLLRFASLRLEQWRGEQGGSPDPQSSAEAGNSADGKTKRGRARKRDAK